MKLLRALRLPLYWILAAACIVYLVFWTPYRLKLEGRESVDDLNAIIAKPPRHVDAETMRLLGRVSQTQVSQFIHFDQAKASGVVRVCALGDSHTRGDEVGERDDYPSLLQALFDHHGYQNVEVLNFGSGWHGFAQIHVMWTRVASRFDCDFVLLLPMLFWHGRDTTFNHSARSKPGYLHARLIPEGDHGLRLLPPPGGTGEQRRDAYLQAIPDALYRRYDRTPVSFIDALLPAGRTIENPFYYDSRSSQDEVHDIYPRIVREIAVDGPQLLVLLRGDNRGFEPWLMTEAPDGVGLALLSAPWDFPYLAPGWHPSSWGNGLVAEAFFRLLTGSATPGSKREAGREVERVVAHDRVVDGGGAKPPPLHSYTAAWLEYGSDGRGLFVPAASRMQGKTDQHLDIFQRQQIAALLALTPPDQGIAQGCLLPLAEVPAAGSELVFEANSTTADAAADVDTGAARGRIVIGRLVQPQADVALFTVTAAAPGVRRCPGRPDPDRPPAIGRDGRYSIDGRTVAVIDNQRLSTPLGAPLALRDDGGYHLETGESRRPMTVGLALESADGRVLRRSLMTLAPQSFQSITYRQAPARLIKTVAGQAQLGSVSGEPP